MSDDPELAAIRARMMRGWPVDNRVFEDRTVLLRRLDAMTAERDALRAERDAFAADNALHQE